LTIEVTGASAGAVKAVEKAGGKVSIVEMPKRPAKLKSLESKEKIKSEAKTAKKKPVKTTAKSSAKTTKKDS
jgi:hypothetical protein